MAKRGIRVSTKLIGVSTLLVILVIGVFAAINSMQSRRIIDDSIGRLRDRITDGLRQAGVAQTQLLADTSASAILQNDFTTLREITQNVARQDDRVTQVAVIDEQGMVVASSDPAQVERKLPAALAGPVASARSQAGAILPDQKMVFAREVRHQGRVLCTVLLVYSLRPLHLELEKAEQLKVAEVRRSLRDTLLVGVFSILLGVLLAVLQGLSISRPIQAVVRQVNQIAGGDLQARVDIRSHDEIGLLGDRFNYMAEQVLVLMRETMKKATMEKELEVASAIQATLVPDSALLKLDGVSLAGYFKPATQCGGDWWSYYVMPDRRVLVIIGDVTGHGVASAMITAAAKGAATTMMAMTHGKVELRPLLTAMNAAIHDAAKGRFVMTCFASIFDPSTRTLTFANAGHNFPYLQPAASQELVALVVRGNRLGDVVDSDYEIKQIQVSPGDILVWYTDGVVECEDVRGEEFGEKRFRGVLRKVRDLPPDQARDEIIARANQFYGGVPQKDDITLVIAKFS